MTKKMINIFVLFWITFMFHVINFKNKILAGGGGGGEMCSKNCSAVFETYIICSCR